MPRPLGHIVHTMGWPLRKSARYGEFGGSFIYPMGEDMVSLGFVAGLEYRDVEFSVHDVLQELKTHKLIRKILAGGERIAWGAKTITEGGYHALPKRFHAPGPAARRRGRGTRQRADAEGDPLCDRVRDHGRRGSFRSLQPGESPTRHGAFDSYDDELRSSYVVERPARGPQHAPGLRQGVLRRRRARKRDDGDEGKAAAEGHSRRGERRADADPDRPSASDIPKPDGKLTFDKLSSVFLSGNRTRDDQPNHIRIQRTVPKDVAEAWVYMCPAQVYEVGGEAGDGLVHVDVNPSNCVQCGAISAKGGRLTPPEGGSGPEYTLT